MKSKIEDCLRKYFYNVIEQDKTLFEKCDNFYETACQLCKDKKITVNELDLVISDITRAMDFVIEVIADGLNFCFKNSV